MTRAQRVVRIGIWALLPFMLVGSLDLAATLMSQYVQDRDVLTLPSLDGRYAATLNISSGGCGDASTDKSQTVYVERRLGGVKTGLISPFCINDPSAKINLSWRDKRTLIIACEGCDERKYAETDSNWGDLRFVFDLNRDRVGS